MFHVKHAMPRSRNLRQSTHTDAVSVVSRAAVRPSLWVSELSALLAVGRNHDSVFGISTKALDFGWPGISCARTQVGSAGI